MPDLNNQVSTQDRVLTFCVDFMLDILIAMIGDERGSKMNEQTPLPAEQPDEEQEILRLMQPALDNLQPKAATGEAMHYVVIHDNDTVPYEYVVQLLESFFMVSEELADHIAWTAHTKGAAVVAVRPCQEAMTLVQVAQGRARYDGFPLIFTLEPAVA